jgi:hypothetical protein
MSNIKFALLKIKTEQFAILQENYKENKKEIKVNFGVNFSSIHKDRIVAVKFSVKFLQAKNPFILLDVVCFFQIEKVSWDGLFNEDNSAIIIPKGLARHLSIFVVGTTRGVLHTKTENTPFNNFSLPTINLNELIFEDILLKIEGEQGNKN